MLIIIGVPSRNDIAADFWLSTLGIWATDKNPKGCFNWRGPYVTESRSIIVEKAQSVNATHLLFLDSDNTFPPDVIDRLLSHNKDIVGATYLKRVPPYDLLGEPLDKPSDKPLIQMKKMPTGCLMIKMHVFDKLQKPYFRLAYKDGKEIGEDYNFCQDVGKLGYSVWCDQALSVQIGHVENRVVTIPLIYGNNNGS